MDIREKAIIKNNILKCINMCGGITGKFAKELCPDEAILQEMMEDGQIKRIPIEVKMQDKSTKKMYIYEIVIKQKTAQFPHMREEDAAYISLLNKCYCQHLNAQWFEKSDIKRFVESSELNHAKFLPQMMFYNNDEFIAVYISRSYSKLSDADKERISKELMVDKVLEYIY